MTEILAVIPARGGSKRCPRKNARLFRGKPLLAYSIEAARASKYITRIVVSTEDREIKDMALMLRAEVIDRPDALATDSATNEDVVRHALSLYPVELVVLLQPTSPLRTAADIDACIDLARTGWGCISYNEDTHAKNGAVYVAYSEWIAQHDFGHAGLRKYMMPGDRSLDIDFPEQFQ